MTLILFIYFFFPSLVVILTAATDTHSSQNAILRGRDDKTLPTSVEQASEIYVTELLFLFVFFGNSCKFLKQHIHFL